MFIVSKTLKVAGTELMRWVSCGFIVRHCGLSMPEHLGFVLGCGKPVEVFPSTEWQIILTIIAILTCDNGAIGGNRPQLKVVVKFMDWKEQTSQNIDIQEGNGRNERVNKSWPTQLLRVGERGP